MNAVRSSRLDVLEEHTIHTELNTKVETVRYDLSGKIDAIKESLASAKVWALMLYFALAGSLLYVLARGFKWI